MKRKPGRPKLSKKLAKGAVLRVRVTPDQHLRLHALAKANRESASAFMRRILLLALDR